ncbi:hypothetical protein BV898_15939 [Hypsibius exemplaris]|uniref:Hsp70 family protein n=1 Tax=Hypsibius exemplaris TaxID=2072580 RepID=A0A9X6NEY1_HYPEX|nr:hypothetical protein BV898_15939 [Hypsibius exemplaris]
MAKRSFTVGIDLGTTNSTIAICTSEHTGGRTTCNYSEFRTGSVITFTYGESGHLSLLGKSYEDPAVDLLRERWHFDIVKGPGSAGEIVIPVTEKNVRKTYTPTELCGMILRELIGIASKLLNETFGTAVTEVVLTAPLRFTAVERLELKTARELAAIPGIVCTFTTRPGLPGSSDFVSVTMPTEDEALSIEYKHLVEYLPARGNQQLWWGHASDLEGNPVKENFQTHHINVFWWIS